MAATDPATGKSEFRYQGNNTPPVIRVQPGSTLNVEYKNELAARSKEDCLGHPCMQMTNLHFHGLHVSPNTPQDDVLDMMASPGETLHYSVQVPPQQPPGLYWYHTHSHGESYVQDLDGMSGAIVVAGIDADLEMDSESLEVVALDGMPFAYHDPSIRSRSMSHVLLPPAGRVEAIVTGPSADSQAALRSRCFDTGPDGDSNPAMVLADIVSTQPSSLQTRPALGGSPVYAIFSPTTLKRVEAGEPQFVVTFTEDKQGFYINDQKFEMNSGPMLTVDVGSLRRWRVTNSTKEVHPFHIHQVHFLPYAVDGNAVKDPAWVDTVNVPYGSSVDLVMDFTDPIIRGMSLFHCHLLKHEDKGMMAKVLFR